MASLHYCFDTKEDLLFAIYERQLAQGDESPFVIEEAVGIGRAATSLLRQIIDWWVNDTVFAQAQEELYLWIVRQNPELGLKVCRVHLDVVVDALTRGASSDADRRLTAPLATLVTSIADGMLLQWLAYRDRDRLAADIDFACFTIEASVAAQQRDDAGAVPAGGRR